MCFGVFFQASRIPIGRCAPLLIAHERLLASMGPTMDILEHEASRVQLRRPQHEKNCSVSTHHAARVPKFRRTLRTGESLKVCVHSQMYIQVGHGFKEFAALRARHHQRLDSCREEGVERSNYNQVPTHHKIYSKKWSRRRNVVTNRKPS